MLVWTRLQLSDVGAAKAAGLTGLAPKVTGEHLSFLSGLSLGAPVAPAASSLGLCPGFSRPVCPTGWA